MLYRSNVKVRVNFNCSVCLDLLDPDDLLKVSYSFSLFVPLISLCQRSTNQQIFRQSFQPDSGQVCQIPLTKFSIYTSLHPAGDVTSFGSAEKGDSENRGCRELVAGMPT